MKNLKKIVCILAVMLLSMGICVSAAAAETGTITINNAVEGQTYTIWRLLDLESYSTDDKAYSYTVSTGWEAFFKGENAAGAEYIDFNNEYVVWKSNKQSTDDKIAFAKAAKEYTNGKSLTVESAEAKGTTLTFGNLPLGYYLVDTTMGTLCSLDTTAPGAAISEKNVKPTLEKEVQEDSSKEWYSRNDADINQTITFRAHILAQSGAENYVFHDKMSNGLTFKEVTAVNIVTQNSDKEAVIGEGKYTVNNAPNDGCTFHVSFDQHFLDGLKRDEELYIYYTADLNESAVVGGVAEDENAGGNQNEAWLEYGEQNRTESSITRTYTWELNILKFANVSGTEKALEGAQFVLKTVFGEGKPTQYAMVEDKKIVGWTMNVDYPDESNKQDIILDSDNDHVVDTNPATAATKYASILTTDVNGKIEIDGLDGHTTYKLEEVVAPAGYNRLADDVEVTIDKRGNVTVTGAPVDDGMHMVKIENKTGKELPSTGGVGTTIFYVLGSILVLGAVVLLVAKRRMNRD